jgi:nucleotide-binding universal stress UspA family protein
MPMPTEFKSILVPTDYSEGALQALRRALSLPLAPKAKVSVVHVVPDDIPGTLRAQALEEAERSIEKQVARVRAELLEAGRKATITAAVLEGATVKQLRKRARTVEAELVVMGRHGRRPVADLLIGTTAQRMVRGGEVPVLVVQSNSLKPYQRPLAAVQLSRRSEGVLRTAARLASAAPALHVFHASSVPYEDFLTLPGPAVMAQRERALEDGQSRMESLVRRVSVGLALQPKVESGDARSLIHAQEESLNADLVVLGSHGRQGVERLLLGSVAEWVLTHASCDVAVVPA